MSLADLRRWPVQGAAGVKVEPDHSSVRLGTGSHRRLKLQLNVEKEGEWCKGRHCLRQSLGGESTPEPTFVPLARIRIPSQTVSAVYGSAAAGTTCIRRC